jgi:hypothetical protein
MLAALRRISAANIEREASRAIYSDDPDAIPRLRRKIKAAEESRARIKRYTLSARRGRADESILDQAEREDLHSARRVGMTRGDLFPGFRLTNLSGQIKRDRDRLAQLERK